MSAYKMVNFGAASYADYHRTNDNDFAAGESMDLDPGNGKYRARIQGRTFGTDIHPKGADSSSARSINNNGIVVGYSQHGENYHAFMYDDGSFVDLHAILGASYSGAIDINDKGQVVGTADFGTTANPLNAHAFLHDPNSSTPVKDLGTLPGTTSSVALAINNFGHVVGWSEDENTSRPFFYDGTMHEVTGDRGLLSTSMIQTLSWARVSQRSAQRAGMHTFGIKLTASAFFHQICYQCR